MRSFKYHDYSGVRIVLFLILAIVLLLLVYKQFIEAPLDHSEHDFTWVTEKEATCLEDGARYKLCNEHNEKFGYETIPATGHTPGVVVKEKDIAPTCTVGGSHDLVVYCVDCDVELERETVKVDKLGHTPGGTVKENNVAPTCTASGSYDLATYCTRCDVELDRKTLSVGMIPHTTTTYEANRHEPTHATEGHYDMVTQCTVCKTITDTQTHTLYATGHNFTEWEIVCDGDINSLVIKFTCPCGEEKDNELIKTVVDGVEIKKDESNVPCVNNKYVVKYTYGEIVIEEAYVADSESHALDSYEIEGLGTVYVSADEEALYDEEYGKYYVLGTKGIWVVIDPSAGETAETVWDENGFAIGVYHCPVCDKYIAVALYSAERDTRLNSGSEN